MKELNNKKNPLQVRKLVLTGKLYPMDKRDTNEYVYISTDSSQSLTKVLSDKLSETWEELGIYKNPKEIIESDEFIKKIEENNIYYMDSKYMDFQKLYIFALYTKMNDIWGVEYVLRIHWCNKRRIL